jgi:glycine dehydrogenase subunit 1
MDFIPHTEQEIGEMMDFLGIKSIDELFDDIPEKFKANKLGLGKGLDEIEVFKLAYNLASKNKAHLYSLAGCGVYFHYVPSVCDFVSSLPGFFTSYTPYQAELSQGIMKALFYFQSLMTELFNMDVSNAGMYGGASALAEACIMAHRMTKKKVLLSAGINPLWLEVVVSYLKSSEIDFDIVPLKEGRTQIKENDDIFVMQSPNFLGALEDLEEARGKSRGIFIVAVPDPVDMAILEPPGSFGADIVVSDGQPLGNYPYFGGSSLGIFLTKKENIRRMPGRIMGETHDMDGNTCYAMILQTREQHIRREKATSNICTATSLLAVRSAVFLKYYGEDGLKKIAQNSEKNSMFLRERLKPIFQAEYIKEFPTYADVDEKKFLENGILPPVRLERILPKFLDEIEFEALTGLKKDAYIICTTEIFSDEEIKRVRDLF